MVFIHRHKIAEILSKVRQRDGLPKTSSHLDHLVGRVSSAVNSTDKELPSLDLADKTQLILQSNHPVRHVLERESYNNSKGALTYYDWLMLFGRGVCRSKASNYEEILNFISRASCSGMFSSEIHSSVVDMSENFKPTSVLSQYALGNKYATLVGDYFAIRCISFIQRSKNSKALMAITKGIEQFSSSNFASFLDPNVLVPILPHANASLEEWSRYSQKTSGYFTGGLYAAIVVNFDGLPRDEKLLENFKKFSSNLSVLLKTVSDIETFENADDFSSVPPTILTSLPAVLYQKQYPTAFTPLRQKEINIQVDYKQILDKIDSSSVIDEAKFIAGKLAQETRKNFEEIATDVFYSDVVNELVQAVSNFDYLYKTNAKSIMYSNRKK